MLISESLKNSGRELISVSSSNLHFLEYYSPSQKAHEYFRELIWIPYRETHLIRFHRVVEIFEDTMVIVAEAEYLWEQFGRTCLIRGDYKLPDFHLSQASEILGNSTISEGRVIELNGALSDLDAEEMNVPEWVSFESSPVEQLRPIAMMVD